MSQASTTITTPYSGVTRHSVDNRVVNGRSVDYEVIVINTLDAGVSFFLTPDNGAASYETTRQTTRAFASAFGTEVAINAHFFDISLSPNTDNTGVAASNGTVYSPFESVGGLNALNITQDNFPETVTGIYGATTFASSPEAPYTAINPGSMLIRDGAVLNTGATDFRARSQIGVSRNGAELMLFASSSGMTEQECATILVTEFGAFNVHGLDGGGSTALVLRTGASTQSIIARESSFGERAVGTNLGVQAAPFVAGIPDQMAWDADPSTPGIQQGSGAWDVAAPNWQAGAANRTWANAKSATLGEGSGSSISLGNRIAVRNLTADGGYSIGSTSGPSFTILGNVTVSGSQPTTILSPLGASSSFVKLGNQTLVLGASSRVSMLAVSEGQIDLGGNSLSLLDPLQPLTVSGGGISNGRLFVTQSAASLLAVSGTTEISADYSSPRMVKTGEGAVYLRANNTWGVSTVINGGTLGLGPSATWPTLSTSITSGMLDLDGATAAVTTLTMGSVAGASTSVATGTGILTLGGTLTYNATNSPAGATISGRLGLGGARSFAVNDSPAAPIDLTVSADISGAFALTKTGAGTLFLSGTNSFTSFRNTAGITRSGGPNALGTTTLTIDSGEIDLNGFDETVTGLTMGGVAGSSAVLRTGEGTLALSGTITYSASNNDNGALIQGRINLGSATRTVNVGNSVNAVTDLRIEASVAGSGGLTKSGAGRLEFAEELSFQGTFAVNNGEVFLSGGNSVLGSVTLGGTANATAILDTGLTTLSLTGTLAYSSSNNPPAALLRGRIDLGATQRTLTINNSSNAPVDLRIEAEVLGSGGFVKGGPGALELAARNSLSGPISITAGALVLSHPDALGNATSLAFSGGSSLNVTGLPDATLVLDRSSLAVSGTGSLTGNVSLSSGRLQSVGNLAISGDLSVAGGMVEARVGSGSAVVSVGGHALLGGALKVTMGGTITGTQSIPIITANSVSGSFGEIELPTPPSGTVYFISVTPTQVLFRSAPGTPAQLWLGSQGLSIGSDLSLDPDGDGHSLLAEYALDGGGTTLDGSLISSSASGISFRWNTGATDLSYYVEGSSNLSDWTTILSRTGSAPWTGIASFTQGSLVDGFAPVSVIDPVGGTPRFLRLRVIKP